MLEMILFDLDGTLLPMDNDEFTKGYFKLLAQKLYPYGYDAKELVDVIWKGTACMVKNDGSQTNEQAFWACFAKMYGEEKLKDRILFEEFYANEFKQAQNCCGYDPKAKDIVQKVKDTGYRIALASNPLFPQSAMRIRVEWAGLNPDDFERIPSYENSTFSKPNPGYYQELAHQLGIDAKNCLMVGNDVEEDMVAEKIGMHVFLYGQESEAYPSGDFDALYRYIQTV